MLYNILIISLCKGVSEVHTRYQVPEGAIIIIKIIIIIIIVIIIIFKHERF